MARPLIKVIDIIPMMERGYTNRYISMAFKKSPVTIARWIGLLKKKGYQLPQRKVGRRKTLDLDL